MSKGYSALAETTQAEEKVKALVSRVDGQLTVDYKKDGVSLETKDGSLVMDGNDITITTPGDISLRVNSADYVKVPEIWESSTVSIPDLAKLRIATQVREFVLQGITIKNTLKEMNEVWLGLYTQDKQCLIVDQQTTKVRAQLISLYAIKLIKYLNSIVGLDLVPLSQQVNPSALDLEERDPSKRSWKMDSVLLNVGSNPITSHEHLFTVLLVNLFGVSEEFVKFSLDPTWDGLRQLVLKTYDYDLGDTEGVLGYPTLPQVEHALRVYLIEPKVPYSAYTGL